MRSLALCLGLLSLLFVCVSCSNEDNELKKEQLITTGQQNHLRVLQQPAWSLGKVVTLGDSFASGLGLHRWSWGYDETGGGTAWIDGTPYKFNPRGGNCYREVETVPGGRLANYLGLQHIQLGCSGAHVSQVKAQFEYLNRIHPIEEYMGWDQSTIILSAGGNDIQSHDGDDWSRVITECIVETARGVGCNQYRSNNVENLDTVENSIVDLYTLVASRAWNARIRIFGYPKLMQPDPIYGCGVLGISGDEAGWIDSHIDLMNDRLIAAVARVRRAYPLVDIEYIDVGPYITRGACGKYEQQINSIVTLLGFIPTPSSFHPNQAGYDSYFHALWDSLAIS